MSIQTRSTALQNEIVRLYCTFIKDGTLTNPLGQPSVEILDTDGVTVIDILSASMENYGIFYVDWYVPANLPLGSYYDKWNFQFDAYSGVQELTMIISVHSLDSYVNFISRGNYTSISNRANQLIMDLNNNFIYEAQHIPIYFEQAMRIQQENQAKRSKSYYYFTLASPYYYASSGAIYSIGGKQFTVFEDLVGDTRSSSSSLDSSSSSSLDSSSSQSTSSLDSSSSTESSSSRDESSLSENPYVEKTIMTCVGSSDPSSFGEMTLVSGTGSSKIAFTSYDKKVSHFSTIYGFAYKNWNQDPAPIVRANNMIVEDGWHLDYDGKIYFDGLMAPEDSINVAYNFAYFSKEELLSFLRFGLQMMNGLPPSSMYYSSLETAPAIWDAGIILYAAITALKRLIFGWNFQEKRIIFGRPEDAQHAQTMLQDLYKSYNELWIEFGKNVKTKKLPGIAMSVTPEYTLPGGRSRWFRYLYKGASG